ncbi:hypothetical protein MP228_007267 [Amoeboaphelidium protococcarum]|nr:hypothetical protein MP228_007267 [Amoeboaphelidium protococcarum]
MSQQQQNPQGAQSGQQPQSQLVYELYRHTSVGVALTDALDELIRSQQITPLLARKIILQFDKSMTEALSTKTCNKVNLKQGQMDNYNYLDDVWTFELSKPAFKVLFDKRPDGVVEAAGPVKLIACNSKRSNDGQK